MDFGHNRQRQLATRRVFELGLSEIRTSLCTRHCTVALSKLEQEIYGVHKMKVKHCVMGLTKN